MAITEEDDFPLCDEDFDFCEFGNEYADCSECPLKEGELRDTLDSFPPSMYRAIENGVLLEKGLLKPDDLSCTEEQYVVIAESAQAKWRKIAQKLDKQASEADRPKGGKS